MIDDSCFPVPRPGYALHLTAAECTLFHVEGSRTAPKTSLGYDIYDQWQLPRHVARYLVACNGTTRHGEIACNLGKATNGLLGRHLATQAVEALRPTEVLKYEAVPHHDLGSWRITGAWDSYAPLHISFEITETCNFRCDHCYVSASPEKHGRKNGMETIRQLDRLAAAGVIIVELTGGECTTHPEFREILAHAAKTFHVVGVITNGFILGRRPDLAEFVASFPNVIVQISIDGTREFHDKFRHMPGSFDMGCKAARLLKENGTFVRVGMTVTEENVEQLESIFFVAKDLGVDALGVAATTSFGRAANLVGCGRQERDLNHRIGSILAPYADDPLFTAVKREREAAKQGKAINCGAGWRSFALNNNGTVRSCLFLADSKKFGNIDTEDYDQVFRRKEMRLFRDAPSPGSAECVEEQPDGSKPCAYLSQCIGCFAKAFRISETGYPECPWRVKYFPGMKLTLESDNPNALIGVQQLVRAGAATAAAV